MSSNTGSLLTMAIIIALIPLALWGAKRIQAMRPGGIGRQIEMLCQLPLGVRERVVLVRVHGRLLVLGATAQQVSLLAELDSATLQDLPPAPPANAFGSLLAAAGAHINATRGHP